MSKEQKSKLDPFAEGLDEWLGILKMTLAEAQAELAKDGCHVSLSRLSSWWEARCSANLQEKLLAQIAAGASQCKDVEKTFADNPAPQMETIIKLHRVLIMQLSTQSQSNPALLQLADQLTRTALEFASGQTKAELEKQKIALANRRVKLLEQKAAAYDRAQRALESAKSSKGGITPATLAEIERELKLL